MYAAIYCEINVICIVLLFYVSYRIHKSVDQQSSNIAFRRMLLCVIIILVLDSIWAFFDGNQSNPFMRYINEVINILYMFQTGVVTYAWMYYTESKLEHTHLFNRSHRVILSLPLVMLFSICVTSPWTKWVFYVDSANVYHRGEYYFLQPLMAYFYLIVSTYYIIIEMKKTKLRDKRLEMLTLLSFFFMPAIGSVISIVCLGLPIIWPLATISLVTVFINFQSYDVSTDGLTGLNNRRQFDKRLRQLVNDHHSGTLALLMMDIDAFKKINDTYGHYEGDKALLETSQILKEICNDRDIILCRYGGDEFAAICSFDSIEAVYGLKENIKSAFAQRNNNKKTKYDLILSIGIEQYANGHAQNIRELFAGADSAMYKEKHINRINM